MNNKNKVNKDKILLKKILVFLGIIVLCIIAVYLMYYFFVKKNNIMINMSTDKKVEYIKIENKDELITTQKYISDLEYSMRYDVNNFKVFKNNSQDVYKNIKAEKIILLVERASLPNSCKNNSDSCIVKIDNYTKEYYFTKNDKTFKILVRTPNISESEQNVNARIDYMLKSFTIND